MGAIVGWQLKGTNTREQFLKWMACPVNDGMNKFCLQPILLRTEMLLRLKIIAGIPIKSTMDRGAS